MPQRIYFWRCAGTVRGRTYACGSRRPHSHSDQHIVAEIKQMGEMRRSPPLGRVEPWQRLCGLDKLGERGDTRRPESLFRLMRRFGMFRQPKPEKKHMPQPCEQRQYPSQCLPIDVKVVCLECARACIADPELRLLPFPAMVECSSLHFLGAYDEQSTFSSADFLR